MIIGTNGLKLIKHFEGCRLEAYRDQAGVWTIGWGHTFDVTPGEIVTQQHADTFLVMDLNYHEKMVDTLVQISLTQNQFDALVSFCYNEGPAKLRGSHLLRYLNSGSPLAAANELSKWVYAGGHRDEGLIKRRACEKILFLTPDNEEFSL